jgi:AraC-like DNA-binding protein
LSEQAQFVSILDLLFSTGSVHERDRLSYWHEEATKAFVTHEFSTTVGRGFEGEIRVGSIGPIDVANFTCDPALVRRTTKCLKFATDDDLLMTFTMKGTCAIHQDGRDTLSRPGGMYLVDPRRPFSLDIRSASETLLLKVPRAEFEARLGDLTDLTARFISVDRPEADLAMSFATMLVERAPGLEAPLGEKVAQQVLDLIALAFEVERPTRRAKLSSSRATTLLRLKSTIEARLHEPGFKPSVAAEATGISVRYANALLAEENTSLERYILFRRLQRCRQALEDPIHLKRPISEIAYDHGFMDVSHFTRRFRAQFGHSPREHRVHSLAPR